MAHLTEEKILKSNHHLDECSNVKLDDKIQSYIEEDHAESVDSGCIPDEHNTEMTWEQMVPLLNSEYDFCGKLLQHIYANKKETKTENDVCSEPSKDLCQVKMKQGFPKEKKKKADSCVKSHHIKENPSCSKEKVQIFGYHQTLNDNLPSTSHCKKQSGNIKISVNSKDNFISKKEEKIKLQQELMQLRKMSNKNKSKLKKTEKKILRRLKVLDHQAKKEKKHLKRDKKSALAVDLGLVESVDQANKIYNHCGKLVYSKFDFSSHKKEKWTENKSFDLNSFLSNLLKEKEKVNRLKDQGQSDKAANFYESNSWKRAMMKAQGQKVKDDIDMVKKSLARKKLQKKRSKAKWAERERHVQKLKEQRQERRQQNITARKEKKGNKKSKGKKGKKKGGRIPGF